MVIMMCVDEITNSFLETHSPGFGDSPHEIRQKNDLITDEILQVLEIIFYVCLAGVISVLGIVTNSVNMVIFFKQGFQDSVNISMFSLAVADIGSLLFLVWRSLLFNPLFQASNVGFDYVQFQQVTAGWPHGLFVRITSWVTAFITLERCVCIALPLKVKDIISPIRTLISICSIFSISIAVSTPVFFTVHFIRYVDDRTNTTVVGISYTAGDREIQKNFSLFNSLSHFFALISVMSCTAVLIYNLINHSKRRHNAMMLSSSTTLHRLSTRDKHVAVMVLSISSIYIVCFFPNFLNTMITVLYPDYNVGGRYQNAFILARAIHNTLEAVNSSIHILVFHKTSCNFRAAFNKLFGCGQELKGDELELGRL